MKKIPTLFERIYEKGKRPEITSNVTPGMEWVLEGEGVATTKLDGSACALINGVFYKRYDAKEGKPIPEKAIKCQEEADPITGHLPCWVPCNSDPADQWFWAALNNSRGAIKEALDGYGIVTYEAIGPHFGTNPHGIEVDILVRHGILSIEVERSFDGIHDYLRDHYIEGIVFWKDGSPQCKIKRSDFGFGWNGKK